MKHLRTDPTLTGINQGAMSRTATISQRRGPLEDDGASHWYLPPEGLALGIDEVHVWRAALNQADAQVSDLLRTLSDDERERARRFRFRKDRHRFIAAHGIPKITSRAHRTYRNFPRKAGVGVEGKQPGARFQYVALL